MTMWVIATFVAFFVKGVCGFANTLVFTSILSYGTANANISPTELLIGYPMNLLMTWKNRKELKIKVWLPLSLLVLFGSIPGAFVLKNVDAGIIKVFFGIVVSVLGVQMFLQEYQHKTTKPSKITMLIMGIVGGMLCGLFGVGAMLGVCVTRMTDTMTEFKGNEYGVCSGKHDPPDYICCVGTFYDVGNPHGHDSDRNCTDRYVCGYAVQ